MTGWVIFSIILAIGVFFLCREIMCWYYKINRLVELMEDQNSLLKDLVRKNNSTSTYMHDIMKKCPFCAEEIKSEAKICPHCGKNIMEYENELKSKQEEDLKKQEQEMKEKYKNITDIFSDEDVNKMSIDEKDKYAKKLRTQFEETIDETEKKYLAKNLTALGYGYYRRFT